MRRLDSRRAGIWADALTIVSLVALGVCVAAVVDRVSPPNTVQSEAAPSSFTREPTREPTPVPEPTDTTYLEPEVDADAPIPGCDTVEPPAESAIRGQISTSVDTYDNPQYPWYDGRRAVMMTDAVAAALPDRVEVQFGSRRTSLIFQPIPQSPADPGGPRPPGFASATADMARGDTSGLLAVSVRKGDGSVPSCVAGQVDERSVSADGSVVDVNESWYQYGPDRTNFRTVEAYYPDGTQVTATASDAPDFPSTRTGDRDIVLTVAELEKIAEQPELRVSAPVPADTPEPTRGCSDSFGFEYDGPTIDGDTAGELNDALGDLDIGESFSPALDSLMLVDFSTSAVCTHVDVQNTGADLTVTITGGAELPVVPDVYDPSYADRPMRTETLDSGAVLEVDENGYSYSPAPESGPAGGSARVVTVTYPSGTQVDVRSHAEKPDEPLTADALIAIATADGLDVL
ncbi:hypothetical protein CH253_29500 [Rhodococcus sp. 06-156-3C]|uniref:hypothetical protein n=1 Tax=Nocardiaceae TaxID=85025 RepID=UPI000522F6CB|nr:MULTISPECIES: hypothetical protein [Rhodococcus]OZD10822.1 hypothetical protein CH280_21460 [Rhodococcus sp. 06-156-4C]OZD11517.1 hypothetical protein CH253_29500 [Rhodococcus sp. 06-156-3C]OZD13752.1 hypothetical protein CH248_27005 [Rhodococcus sp. 06-156-4a]OZD28101.1 hypothetical protein CH247_20155 [Rhodococcus sp. 06-156-3b]OZD30376.1 hypothetical protein CH284_25585 [Rhodococcus sp. 06-156-3]